MSVTFFFLLLSIALPALLIVAVLVASYREGGTQPWWK